MAWIPVKLKVVPRLLDENSGELLHECSIWTKGQNWGQYWRWSCSCSDTAHGRSQGQGPYTSVFQWFRHAWRAAGVPWPRSSEPAYKWMEQEKSHGG